MLSKLQNDKYTKAILLLNVSFIIPPVKIKMSRMTSHCSTMNSHPVHQHKKTDRVLPGPLNYFTILFKKLVKFRLDTVGELFNRHLIVEYSRNLCSES